MVSPQPRAPPLLSFHTMETIPRTSRYLNGSHRFSYRKVHIQERQNLSRIQLFFMRCRSATSDMHLIRRATCRRRFIIVEHRAGGSSYLYTAALSALLRLSKMYERYKYVPVRSLIYSLVNGSSPPGFWLCPLHIPSESQSIRFDLAPSNIASRILS